MLRWLCGALAPGSRLMRITGQISACKPHATISEGASATSFFSETRGESPCSRKIGDQSVDLVRACTISSSPGITAELGEQNVLDRGVLGRCKEECTARWISSAAFSMKGRSTFRFVVLRQPGALGRFGFSRLMPYARMMSCVSWLPRTPARACTRSARWQHRDVHDVRAQIDQRDILVFAVIRNCC